MKHWLLVIVLLGVFAVHVNLSKVTDSIDEDADDPEVDVQMLSFVVQKMNKTELGKRGQYKARPAVWTAGGKQYVSFTTKLKKNADPKRVYKDIVDYMAASVRNAKSKYKLNGNELTVIFEGLHFSDLKPKSPIQNLIEVLQKFKKASLGGYECEPTAIYETKKGWQHVHILIYLNGSDCKTATNAVYGYLNDNNYLDKSTKKKVTCFKSTAIMKLRQKDSTK
ncbi:hypothetical protein Bhyg_00886 [Pseudolycoriella hygida]|uniref:Uncharacterized protein n=1 Tax=Pseudolycoriella hygida TaxID=35572 RepID=A0A9Q0N8D5_9DIPT|nr:hypothetical protein Bhyg_00886 [Pseudolycoriella hygida]